MVHLVVKLRALLDTPKPLTQHFSFFCTWMKRERETRPAKTIRYRPRDPTKASSHAPQTTAPLHTGLANSTPLSQNTTTTTTSTLQILLAFSFFSTTKLWAKTVERILFQEGRQQILQNSESWRAGLPRIQIVVRRGLSWFVCWSCDSFQQEKEKAKKAEVPKKILPAPSRVNHLYQPTSRLSTFPRALRNREREPNGSWQRYYPMIPCWLSEGWWIRSCCPGLVW